MKIEAALQLMLLILNEARVLAEAINNARAEGRDDLTAGELAAFINRDDAARALLQSKIDSI